MSRVMEPGKRTSLSDHGYTFLSQACCGYLHVAHIQLLTAFHLVTCLMSHEILALGTQA